MDMKIIEKSRLYCYIVLLSIVFSATGFAVMSPVSDTELDSVTGQAFSSFTYTENGGSPRMLIHLDMRVEINAKIEDLKMGFYNYQESLDTGIEGSILGIKFYLYGNGRGHGWNLDFQDLQVGRYAGDPYGNSSNVPFVMDGINIRTDYDIVNGNKMLKTFAIGTDSATGAMYANKIRSYTGVLITDIASNDDFGILAYFMGSWTVRTSGLNASNYLGVVWNVAHNGMHFSNGASNTSGLHLVFDRDIGVGLYAGPPLSQLYNYWP